MKRFVFGIVWICAVLFAFLPGTRVYAQEEIVYHGRNVDINIVNADVVDILLMLAESSDQNIVIDSDVTGTLTLRLIDVPVDQAIDIILQLSGLEAVVHSGVVVIRPIAGAQENPPSEE
jgi:type IV pilus assembly protein PilQ